jgi:hypothetical protein
MSIEILELIIGYEANKNKSPITTPTIPERNNQNQACIEASVGRSIPLTNQAVMLKKLRPMNNRIILTAYVPTLVVALSKARAVMVQKTAVKRAANSPKCVENIL